ncbi:GNAT family N-acetyltransferase [Sutcliffiella deserti]|uniref:GNAT family N-acetyltransferase n=1 Tax=Sutcliffiella deserti TaxID=2875501 RepID=UPI001CBFD865|nr:GNAT family N-acetyltransferase [Sutcliffiella deserti]
MTKTLETTRLTLRPMQLEDAERIEELASDYELAKTTLTVPHPYPIGGAKDFIERMGGAKDIVTFAIIDKEKESLIGLISNKLTPAYERGELGYWIGRPYWGQGYGTEAATAVIEHGFTDLKLNKIFAGAYADNPGSWRIMEKVGMSYEGTWKQHAVRFGKYVDLVYYGLLKEDYKK